MKIEDPPESVYRQFPLVSGKPQAGIKTPNPALYHYDPNKLNGRINKQMYQPQPPPQIQPKPNTHSGDFGYNRGRGNGVSGGPQNNFVKSDETQSLNGINNSTEEFILPSHPGSYDQRNYDEMSVASSTNSIDYNGLANRHENHGRTNSLVTVTGYPAYTKEAKSRGSYFGTNSVTSMNSYQQNFQNPTASNESINTGRFRGISLKVSKHNSSEHLVNGAGHHPDRPSRRAVSQNYLNKDNYDENGISDLPNNEMMRHEHQQVYSSTHASANNATFTRNKTPSYQTTTNGGPHQDYNPLNERNRGSYLSYSDSRHHKSEIALPTQDYDTRGASGNNKIRTTQQTNYRFTSESQQQNNDSAYALNENSGPSFRRIQNLQGSTNPTAQNARRFPSDTHLNETKQVYTSGNKPGPVTIPARSRSAQPSPAHSPRASPSRFISTRGPNQRSQNDLNDDEDDEYQILPSVREIIRQVEAMTNQQESNGSIVTSRSLARHSYAGKRDITASTISSAAKTKNALSSGVRNPIERHNSLSGPARNHSSQITVNRSSSANRSPTNSTTSHTNHFINGASNPSYTNGHTNNSNSIMNNSLHNGSFGSLNGGPMGPPIPPHAPIGVNGSRNKQIEGRITRRIFSASATTGVNSPVKTRQDVKNNLPTDYHKLREAFLEQRKEIQRLRKEIADKDTQIDKLRSDIRLYEPWH